MRKILLGLILLLIMGCGTKEKSTKPRIFVSILPQKFFVERIVGNEYEVEVMVPPGQSPATYEPTPQQMVALSNAVLYFKIGVQFEQSWLDKVAELNPKLIFVDTASGIELREMETLEEILGSESEHHAEDDHSQDHYHKGAHDPHIWLAPLLVKTQVGNIADAMITFDTAKTEELQANLSKFQLELDELHDNMFKELQGLGNRELLVFHPSWGYFAREFNLQQIPIELSGKAPTSRDLTKIMKLAEERNIKVIFVQKQFSKHEAEMIAKNISGTVVQIDPLAENYLENMRSIAQQMQESLNK